MAGDFLSSLIVRASKRTIGAEKKGLHARLASLDHSLDCLVQFQLSWQTSREIP